MEMKIFGKTFDEQTRCEHYHGPTDIIAIKFKCCLQYYPCHTCHQESTTHEPKVWTQQDFDKKAILCGVCKTELTIKEYLHSNNTCPHCKSSFNPNCATHYGLYFELP